MSFAHIENLYKNQDILLFRECYALEKIHGESAWITLKRGEPLKLYAGGQSEHVFAALFDLPVLQAHLESLGCELATIFGEVHGGSIMRASEIYGTKTAFTAFDLQIDNLWLAVPQAEELIHKFGLEFVPNIRIPTTMDAIDAQRDAPSIVSTWRGIAGPKQREGVVLRPVIELTKNNGERVICKHKTEKHQERMTNQKVEDPAKLKVLADAQAIADEWVTPMRLEHVLAKLGPDFSMKDAKRLIEAMQEDVTREAAGEIVCSREALTAIGKKAILLFKERK